MTFQARGLVASQIWGGQNDGWYITDPDDPGEIVVVLRVVEGSTVYAIYQCRVKDGIDYPFRGPF
ncbi:MAG: hypothetical protein AAGI01_02385, partial [Myxococcota bacterium]